MRRRAWIPLMGLAVLALPLLRVGGAEGHPLAPALLEILERPGGEAEILWKEPRARFGGTTSRPVLPAACVETSPAVLEASEGILARRWRVDCGPGGLTDRRIRVEGLAETRTDALVRIRFRDGRLVQRVLRAGDSSFLVPARARSGDVLREFAPLGLRHILGGPDHLLFVFGLLLLVVRPRPLALTITAFTAGHSLTLSLAVMGFVRFPTRPIELAIAITVFALAVEVARGSAATDGWMRRAPWAMAFLFGLLHGLGFAGALAQVGLPSGEIPLALLSFNLGIEGGQLLVVSAVLLGRAALLRIPRLPLPAWSARGPVYLMGSLSAFWCFERAAALIGRTLP